MCLDLALEKTVPLAYARNSLQRTHIAFQSSGHLGLPPIRNGNQ